MRKFCVFLRKNKGLGRWPFLDNGPAKIHKRVTTPTASVIIKITVLSTSNTKSRSPATVDKLRKTLQATFQAYWA